MNLVSMMFSVEIHAPRERVWQVMFDANGYREWTRAFSPASTFEGSWSEGSAIRFLGHDEQGNVCGLSSRIAACRPYEMMGIEHLRGITRGEDDAEPSIWHGARENYFFSERDGVTTVRVEQDMAPEYETMFQTMWPEALSNLKALAERKA